MPVSVDIPDEMKKLIDRPVEQGIYKSRSEVIREAIRQFLKSEGLIEKKELSPDLVEQLKKARREDDYRTLEEVKEELGLD